MAVNRVGIPNYGIGTHTGDRAAEFTYRDLYRAQWNDFEQRFLGYQQELVDQATGTQMLDQQLSRISALSNTSRALSNQNAARTRARFGIKQTQSQANLAKSQTNLNKALSQAASNNAARTAAFDRYQNAMTGGSLRLDDQVYSTGGATS